MKKMKSLLKVVSLILPIILLMQTVIYAAEDLNGPTLMLHEKGNGRKTGFYTVSTSGGNNKPVIKIVKANSSGTSEIASSYNEAIYCIKDGVGFGSAGSSGSHMQYTQNFDMQSESEYNGMEQIYKSMLPTEGSAVTAKNYSKLVWILEHICVPSDNTARNALLSAAGLDSDAFDGYSITGKNQAEVRNDIIEAIQQAAIWYYTNPTGEYHPLDTPNFYVSSTNGGTRTNLDDLDPDGDLVDSPVSELYDYFINGAKRAVEQQGYTYKSNYSGTALTYVKGFTGTDTPATTEVVGQNYVIGPFKITSNGNRDYTLTASITNGTSAISGATILASNKSTEVSGSSISAKVKNAIGQDFYVRVPISSGATSVKLDINAAYTTKTIKYWSVAATYANSNQPVAIIQTENQNDPGTATVTLSAPKFDLALRKFITKIGTTDITDRIPEITQANLQALATGNASSAFDNGTTTYKTHKKDARKVSNGQTVVYTIRVYNEGDIDGKVTQITDYLPSGLKLATNSTINSSNGWQTDPNDSKKITTNKLQNETITAFNKNATAGNYSIDYKDVQIECVVDATASSADVHLKNTAEITGATNASNISDRDSTPGDLSTTQRGTDNLNYYVETSTQGKGYQDDDDFEDLVLPGTYFDLALRKFITSKNGTALSTSREPQISQADFDALAKGTASLDDGRTATKSHGKDAISVKAGDEIVYTIRVYNEGQVDGYATEITDYLPEGLSLKEGSTINSEYGWHVDQNNAKKISTVHLQNNKLNAFNLSPTNGTYTISYADVMIECVVNAGVTEGQQLKNIAEITGTNNDLGLSDRDSTTRNVNTNTTTYNPKAPTTGEGEEDDDDFELLIVTPKQFDLALRKFITKINDNAPKTSREPQITQEYLKALADGDSSKAFDNGQTAYKPHTKDVLSVKKADKVLYTIRIYNEGNVNGFASQVTDFLPEGLKLAQNSEINNKYGWQEDANNSQIIRTSYLADKELTAFSTNPTNGEYTIDYKDLEVECEVTANATTKNRILKNTAEITLSQNALNLNDRDSTTSNLTETIRGNNNESYNVETSIQGKGYEDDDDYEDLLLTRFDFALRKFITGVNNEQITNRVPMVDTSKYGTLDENNKEITTFTYTHTKEPIHVEQNNIVTYTIRVYNEGTAAGYIETIKDDIPEGLEFLPDNGTNQSYGWKMLDKDGNETTSVANATNITTDYWSRSRSEDSILLPFDKESGREPEYRDVQVAFKVIEPNTSDRIITNKAQITKHLDENGNDVTDIDSTPDVWNEGEDDQDVEHLYVKYFDLALRKWVTHAIVIEDGVQKEMATGHKAEDDPESVVKVEVNKKRLDNTVVKFRYSIRITNEGEIAGYAKEISDYIPQGLKFNPADNPKWKETNGKIVTDALKDTLLQPGDTATVDVLLTWVNSESNMGVMVNVAEISEDYNESHTPDIDSIPNNKKSGEDDIDDAPVALTVVAGSAPTYIAIASGIALIVGAGVFFIKKYVI